MVDEKVEPGFKVAGMGPLVAENPPADTEIASDERLAGIFPTFFSEYAIARLSPGANGPALANTLLSGRGDTAVRLTYDGPPALAIEVNRRVTFDEPSLWSDVCVAYPIPEMTITEMTNIEVTMGKLAAETPFRDFEVAFKCQPLPRGPNSA
jgi:hypothetical protein